MPSARLPFVAVNSFVVAQPASSNADAAHAIQTLSFMAPPGTNLNPNGLSAWTRAIRAKRAVSYLDERRQLNATERQISLRFCSR